MGLYVLVTEREKERENDIWGPLVVERERENDMRGRMISEKGRKKRRNRSRGDSSGQ